MTHSIISLSLYSGCAANTRGTAFVVYEDIFDAKNACEHLSGFNVCNRYLVVLYYQPHKVSQQRQFPMHHTPITSLNYNMIIVVHC